MTYLHVERYAHRPIALAQVRLYRAEDNYIPRVLLMPAADLLRLYRALKQAGPVKVYIRQP